MFGYGPQIWRVAVYARIVSPVEIHLFTRVTFPNIKTRTISNDSAMYHHTVLVTKCTIYLSNAIASVGPFLGMPGKMID